MAAFFTNRPVGWVKPPQPANPTLDASNRGQATVLHKNHRHLKSQKGMTLVEVLVAVAILAIGLLAIASMQKTAVMVNMRAFDITEAATVAQSQLEQLQSLSINHADLTGGQVGNLAPGYDCDWVVTTNFPGDLTAPPARGRLIQLAVTANGDTTTCGNDGTCGSCAGSNGTGSTISCYSIVGVKTSRP